MPTIAGINSYSAIQTGYSVSLFSKSNTNNKRNASSSPAYHIEISSTGVQQSQINSKLDNNMKQAEFERNQDQRILKFQRNKQAREQEFERNQRQGEINFKQKMQQEEAEFNRNLRQDEVAFKQKRQRAAAKVAREQFPSREAT